METRQNRMDRGMANAMFDFMRVGDELYNPENGELKCEVAYLRDPQQGQGWPIRLPRKIPVTQVGSFSNSAFFVSHWVLTQGRFNNDIPIVREVLIIDNLVSHNWQLETENGTHRTTPLFGRNGWIRWQFGMLPLPFLTLLDKGIIGPIDQVHFEVLSTVGNLISTENHRRAFIDSRPSQEELAIQRFECSKLIQDILQELAEEAETLSQDTSSYPDLREKLKVLKELDRHRLGTQVDHNKSLKLKLQLRGSKDEIPEPLKAITGYSDSQK